MDYKHLKLYKWIDINVSYLVLYAILIAVLYYLVSLDEKEYITPTYQEIPLNDSLLMLNNSEFTQHQLNKAHPTNTIEIKYSPIHSVNQTFNPDKNNKSKIYKLQLKELDIQPTLEEVRINRVKVSLAKHYEIPKGASLVSLKFKDLNSDVNHYYYQFAMSKFGNYEDFCDKNTLNIHLPNGKFNLYIRAIDLKNKTVTKHTKISTYSRIQITKGPWFYPFISILIFIPFFLFIRDLKNNRRKYFISEQTALEDQRCKITADLHDEIGSSLSSLQINSAVANSLMQKNPAEAKKILKKIELQTEQLSDKIGDIIWSMKPGKDEFLSLTSRIKNFTSDILGSSDIDYKIRIDSKADKCITDISTRRNIVFFIKEATNNVAKYSKASQFEIKIDIQNNKILILISDNGIGFDTSVVNGNGLGNMKKRIKELNGEIDIQSDAKKGTSVKAIIPLVP
jgi:signal transduction histidine kinase